MVSDHVSSYHEYLTTVGDRGRMESRCSGTKNEVGRTECCCWEVVPALSPVYIIVHSY